MPCKSDGLRVIESGLKPDDWVVVGGLQQVRPRMQVQPERMPMPTLGQPDGGRDAPRPSLSPATTPAADGQPKRPEGRRP